MTRAIIIFLAVFVASCYAQNTTCVSDSDCPRSAFCLFPPGQCGAPSMFSQWGGLPALGVCQVVPSDCSDWPKIASCGCDRVDYPNPCYAWQNKTSVFLQGTCSQIKACLTNKDCEKTQYCQFSDLNCGATSQGVCAQRPDVCASNDDGLCSCDGYFYRNSCIAAAAGYSPWYMTICPKA